jgi:hypothetical protein
MKAVGVNINDLRLGAGSANIDNVCNLESWNDTPSAKRNGGSIHDYGCNWIILFHIRESNRNVHESENARME